MTIAHLDYPAAKLAPFGRDKVLMEANTDPERAYRIGACAKEPWTVAWIEELQPREVLYDIGANVGSYTLLAAARHLGVVAFEPQFASFATLCRNLCLNAQLDQVVTLQVLLMGSPGTYWLHLHDLRSGSAGHEINVDPGRSTFHKQLVPGYPLDYLQDVLKFPLPTAIKLDVDGAEREVLSGAQGILATPQLRTLMVELRLDWEEEVMGWLAERGFARTARFDEREGKKIGNISYSRFDRRVEEPPVAGKSRKGKST